MARRRAGDDLRDAFGDVGLQPVGGAERHRRRDVEHEPGREDPLGDLQAHVRDPGARAGRRVELAHVVADLVGPQLRELRAAADAGREPVAGKHPGAALRERQRERLDERSRDRPRPLARGRDVQRAVGAGASPCGLVVHGRRGARPSARAPRSAVEDVVGRHAVRQRVVGQHDAVAQHVGGEVADVVARARGAGRAAARARAPPAPCRSRRAGSRRTGSAGEVAEPVALGVARRVDELDGVGDDLAVDEDLRAPRAGSARARPSTGAPGRPRAGAASGRRSRPPRRASGSRRGP